MVSTVIPFSKIKSRILFILILCFTQEFLTAQIAGGTATPNPAKVCSGQPSIIRLNGHIATNYTWQIDTSGIFVNISGAPDADTLLTAPLTKPAKYRAVVSTLTILLYDTSSVASVTVADPSLGGSLTVLDPDICSGETRVITLSGERGNKLQWQLDSTITPPTFVDISGAETNPYSTLPLSKTTKYRVRVTNEPCPSQFSDVVTINVTPASYGGKVKADTNTVCKGGGTNLTATQYVGTSFTWQVDTTGSFVDIPSAHGIVYGVSGLTRSAKYRVSVTNGDCTPNPSDYVQLFVATASVGGKATPDTTICSNNSVTINLTGEQGTIQWQIDTSSTNTFVDIAGAPHSKPYTTPLLTRTSKFRAKLTSGGCPPDYSLPATVTVNPGFSPGSVTADNTTLCSGKNTTLHLTGAPVGTTIQWQSKTTGAYSNIGTNSATLSVVNLTATTTYHAIVTQGICSATSGEITVVVNPRPTAGTVTALDNTVCSGIATTLNLATPTAGATIQWQSKTTGSYTNVGTNSTSLASGALTDATTFRAIATLNGCADTSNALTIIVTPLPTPGNVTALNNSLCSGESTTLNLAAPSSGATIQWQSKTTGIYANVGTNSTTLSTGALTTTTTYHAVVTLNNCSATSNEVIITVKPKPTPGTVTAVDNTLCSGGTTTLNLATPTAGATIQWQSKTTGAYANVGTNSPSLASGPLTVSTTFRAYVELNGCSDTSNAVTVNITSAPSPGTVTAVDNSICSGGTTTLSLAASTPGATIQWQSKTTGAYSNIGTNSTTLSTGILTTTTTYQAIVTLSNCSATSNEVTVTVKPKPTAGTVTAVDNTLCSGLATTLNLATPTPGATIQWQSKTTGGYTNVGTNSTTLSTGNLTVTTTYQAIVTLNNCPATSNEVTITVNPIPTPGVITAVNNSVCSGSGTTLTLATPTAGSTIQWQSKTTGGYTNVGTNSMTLSTGNLTATTTYQAIVTLNNCTATSNEVTITVNPLPAAGSVSALSNLRCQGDSTVITLTGAGTPIQWQSKTTGVYSNIPNANSATYNTGALSTTTTYQAIIGNSGCTSTSGEVTITVNPKPVRGNITPSNVTTCVSTNVTLTLKNYAGQIQWQTDDSGVFADINLENGDTYKTPDLLKTTKYRVVLKSNGCANDTSLPATINIVPLSKGGEAYATPATVCNNQTTVIKLKNFVGGSIQWQRKVGSGSYANIPLGLNDSSFTTQALTSPTYFKAIVKNGNCAEAISQEVLVNIAPSSAGGSVTADSALLCHGTGTAIRLTGYVGSIQWQSDASGTFTNIPTNANSDVYQVLNLTKTTNYKAVVKSNDCPAAESPIITIKLAPASVGGSLSALSTNICSGATAKLTLSGHTTGADIKWQKNVSGTFVTIAGPNGTEYTTQPLTDDTEFRALVTSGHCTSDPSSRITISIIPALEPGTITADQSSVCSGTYTTLHLTGQTGSYQWQTDNGSGNGTFVDIANAKDSALRTPNLVIATSYRAIVSGGSCSSVTSQTKTITVNPPSKGGVATPAKATVCSGSNTNITLSAYDGSIDWQIDDSGTGTGTFTDIVNTNAHSTTYTTLNLTKKTRYRAKVTRAGCASAFSDPATVDVAPTSVAGTISSSALDVCPGSSVTLTLNGSSGTIVWQSDTSGTYTAIPLANSATYVTFPITKETNFRAVVTNGSCPAASTANTTIKIAPALSGGYAVAIPSTICKNTSTVIHLRGYTGDIQWQTNASGTFVNIDNQHDSLLTTPNLTTETRYRAIISSGTCPTVISQEAIVSVIPASEGGTASPPNSTICSGTSTTITLNGNIGSIQWQSDALGSFNDLNGQTNSTLNTGTLTKNTSFRAVVTSNGCPAVNSSAAFVSVTPASDAGIATAVQSSVCTGGTATINLTGYVGTSIQWQSDASGAYTDISTGTNSTLTITVTALTHFRARVKNGSCSTATSNVVTISITPALKGGTAKATPSSVCSGTTTTIKLTGHTGPQIQWQTNASGSYVNIPANAGGNDSILVTPPLTVATNYRAHVNGSGCPQVTSTVASVTIIPLSVGGTVSANPSTICSGEKSVLTVTGQTGTIQWQSDETGSFKDITGEKSPTFTTLPLNNSTSYRAMITSGSCPSEKSTSTLVTVVPSSVSGFAKATPGTVCDGGTSKISLTGQVGDKIQWQQEISGTFTDITGATNSDFPTPALSATTIYRAVVTNGNCSPSVSNEVTISITPVLNGGIATAVQSAICKGTFATIKLTGQSGSIQWQTNASGSWKDIPGANGNTLNTLNLNVPTSFRAVLISGGCNPAYSNPVDISIIPASVGGTASAKYPIVCSGETDTINLTGNTGSIQWQMDTTGVGVYYDIPGATGPFYATGPLKISTTFRAVVISNGCAPINSSEVFVSVAPASKAGIATASALKVCSGATTTLSLNGYTGSIRWQSDATGSFADIPGGTNMTCTTGALKTPTSFRALVTNGNCPSVSSNTITVTITPSLSGGTTTATPSTVCKGTSSTITLQDHSGAVRWQTNASGSWVDIDTIVATDTFYITPKLLVPTSYRAVVNSIGCAPATSTPVTVSVSPASTAGAALATPSSICSGDVTTINLTGYTGTIRWQTNASGVYTDILSATGSTLKTPNLSQATSFRAIVTNGSCLPDTSNIVVISIIPPAVGGVPIASASTVCTGGTTTLTLTKYTGNTIQWQRDSSKIYVDIKSGIGPFYSTLPLLVETTYRAKVNTGNCSFAVSEPITIKVTDELAGGMATVVPSTVCDSTPTTLNLVNYKGSIQWQRDSMNIFVNIPGAQSTPYTTFPLTGVTRFLAVVSSGNCPTVYSNIVTAYVTPGLSPGAITANPSTICSGESTKLKIAGHTGNVQWQKSVGGKFVDIAGQTADTCRINTLLESGWFRAKISSGSCTPVTTDSIMINVNIVPTPTGDALQDFCSILNPTVLNLKVKDVTADTIRWYLTPTGGTALAGSTPLVNGAFYYATRSAYGCESFTRFKVKVTVFKSATVTSQPVNVTTCPGLNTFFYAKGDGTGLSYKWMVDIDGTSNYKYVSDNLVYKGSNTDTLKVLNVSTNMNGYSFKCVIKGSCSPADSALSSSAALIVSPNTVLGQQPTSLSLCYGDAASFSVTAIGSGLTYQWQVDTSNVFYDIKGDSTYLNTNTSSMKIKAFAEIMGKYSFRCVIKSAVCGSTVNSQEAHVSFNEECNVYPVTIPTGFSPNGDGVNDKLVIEGLENYPGSVLRIYNVWGDLVYEKTDYQNDWDGVANVKHVVGEGKLPPGTYYMYVDLKKGERTKATFLIIKY